ncbi:MAG: hypothetical protein BMS9Abin05_1723 [Rhodothermia bacterium]|nr:MAG: hypothetical protein BMS9Abin05_1723 [Rhodothermia bacterium]
MEEHSDGLWGRTSSRDDRPRDSIGELIQILIGESMLPRTDPNPLRITSHLLLKATSDRLLDLFFEEIVKQIRWVGVRGHSFFRGVAFLETWLAEVDRPTPELSF